MRLHVRHRTVYRFAQPQRRLVQLLRVTPRNHAGQTVLAWSLDVDRDVRLRPARDGYGNHATMLYVDGPIDAITIDVAGEVLTEDSGGRVEGLAETLPSAAFLQATPLTAADATVRRFLNETTLPEAPLERAHALMAAVNGRLRATEAMQGADQRAHVRLDAQCADAQGMAHVLIAAARADGMPARYVAGHLQRPGPGERPAAHGWAELHVAGHGWIGFDPHQNDLAAERHVRVAIGLDHTQAAPVSGARLGPGSEEMSVEVRIVASGAGQG